MEVIFDDIITSESELGRPALAILKAINNGCPICLFNGDLGAGKTTLIKNICGKFGVTADMSSPSFALVNEYLTSDGMTIYHFDFYRINDVAEIYDLGHEEYFYSSNPCLIEWPDIAADLIPQSHLSVNIQARPDQSRHITITKHG